MGSIERPPSRASRQRDVWDDAGRRRRSRMNLEPVRRALDALGARYALIGAHAMAARGYPRSTVDIDLLTSDTRVFDAATWVDLTRGGAHIDARRGDVDDPLGGVVHLLLDDGTDVDVIVTKWKWETDILERAEEFSIGGAPIRVPRIADLILLKLAAGG